MELYESENTELYYGNKHHHNLSGLKAREDVFLSQATVHHIWQVGSAHTKLSLRYPAGGLWMPLEGLPLHWPLNAVAQK